MLMKRIPTFATGLAVGALVAFSFGCANQAVQAPASRPIQTVNAKHILIQYEGAMRAPGRITRTQEEAKARIAEILEKARQGEKFEDLAMQYSDGPSASKGGDLGGFGPGMMHPAFEEAAFACDVGGITEIVETPFGYHIIYRYE